MLATVLSSPPQLRNCFVATYLLMAPEVELSKFCRNCQTLKLQINYDYLVKMISKKEFLVS